MNPKNGLAWRDAVVAEGMAVPRLFWFEIRNVLTVNERRGRIDSSDSDGFLIQLEKLIAMVDEEPNNQTVMTMARSNHLTVYDAAYLELAARCKMMLCTLDQDLIAAASKAGASLWHP